MYDNFGLKCKNSKFQGIQPRCSFYIVKNIIFWIASFLRTIFDEIQAKIKWWVPTRVLVKIENLVFHEFVFELSLGCSNLELTLTCWLYIMTNYYIYNFSTLLSGVFIFLIGKDTIKITIIETNSSHVSTGKYYRWLKIVFSVVKLQNSGAVLMSIGLFWTFCVVCFCCYPKDFDDQRMRFSSENCIPICETVQFINGELILFIDFGDLLPKFENSKFEDQKSLIVEEFYAIT